MARKPDSLDDRLVELLYPDELAPEEAARLRSAVEADPEAAATLRRWQAVRQVVARLPEARPDPQIQYDLLREARQAVAPLEKTGGFFAWLERFSTAPAFAGLLLFVVAAGSVVFFSRQFEDEEAAPAGAAADRTIETPAASAAAPPPLDVPPVEEPMRPGAALATPEVTETVVGEPPPPSPAEPPAVRLAAKVDDLVAGGDGSQRERKADKETDVASTRDARDTVAAPKVATAARTSKGFKSVSEPQPFDARGGAGRAAESRTFAPPPPPPSKKPAAPTPDFYRANEDPFAGQDADAPVQRRAGPAKSKRKAPPRARAEEQANKKEQAVVRAPDDWARVDGTSNNAAGPPQGVLPEPVAMAEDGEMALDDVVRSNDEARQQRGGEGAAMGGAVPQGAVGRDEPMDVLARARAARRSGRYAESIDLYRSIIRANPATDPARREASRDLGLALASDGRLREAVDSYETFRQSYPGHHDITQVLFETADAYEKLGDTRQAIQLYRLVAQSGGRLGTLAAKRLDLLQAVTDQPRPQKKAPMKAKMAAPAESLDAAEERAPAAEPATGD